MNNITFTVYKHIVTNTNIIGFTIYYCITTNYKSQKTSLWILSLTIHNYSNLEIKHNNNNRKSKPRRKTYSTWVYKVKSTPIFWNGEIETLMIVNQYKVLDRIGRWWRWWWWWIDRLLWRWEGLEHGRQHKAKTIKG